MDGHGNAAVSSYRFVTLDVFTDRRFGGNPLAVVPDGAGLSDSEMLAITREFNYSETVFVLAPDDARHTRRLRIWTPGGEVPFAGHPTVGTAHALAHLGEIPLTAGEARIVFEEGVGPVPVFIRANASGEPDYAQLSVARLPEELAPPPALETLARVLSLRPGDLLDSQWAPAAVTCGLPFLFVPLRDRAAVERARVNVPEWERSLRDYVAPDIMVFSREADGAAVDVHARVFVPTVSVPEDPATGSAAAALGGYLARRDPGSRAGTRRWLIEQGVEMGRPSLLEVEVDEDERHAITSVRVGGRSVMVSEGTMRV